MKKTEFILNGIQVKQNPLTGDWFVYPPNNELPYIVATRKSAENLIKRMKQGKKC